MLKLEKKLVVTFFTSTEAMATEKACKEANIYGTLISAPRNITSDCGISFATGIEYRYDIENLLKDKNIEFDRIVETFV